VVIVEGKCENCGSLSLSLSSTFASLLSRSFLLLAKFLQKKKNSKSKNEVTLEGFQFSIARSEENNNNNKIARSNPVSVWFLLTWMESVVNYQLTSH
jgi:hypothetical protein